MKFKVIRKQNNSRDCIVCGTRNKSGLNAKFYECLEVDAEGNVTENPVLVTIFRTEFHHQSYPGRTHGGITGALIDEAVGRSVSIPLPHAWGVTMTLSVRYIKPVPLEEELYAVTKTTKLTSRVFEGEGGVYDKDGTLLATCEGRYLKLNPEQISPDGITEENWFYVDEDLPEFIVIGGKE